MCHGKFKSRMKAQHRPLKNIARQQRWYSEHVCCRRKTCANNFGEIIIFIAYRFCFRNYNHFETVFIRVRLRLICCYCMAIDRFYCQRNGTCCFSDKAVFWPEQILSQRPRNPEEADNFGLYLCVHHILELILYQ